MLICNLCLYGAYVLISLMKIAYLAQTYPPMISGQSILTQRLAEGMAGRGHSVLVIAASEKGKPSVESKPNLRVVRLRSLHNPFRVGQRILFWPWRDTYLELVRFQPDLVHAHDPLLSALSGLYALRGMQAKTTMTVHQLPWFVSNHVPYAFLRKSVDKILWGYARWLGRQYDALLVPSETIAGIVHGQTGIKPCAISNGMDLHAFTPQRAVSNEREVLCEKFGLDPQRPIILHVGQLHPQKQVDLVVRASAQAMEFMDAQLLVIGDGKERKALVRLAKGLGIHERCVFPGYVSIADGLPAVYRLGSVFVTASEIETQGLVLLEAMASGVPVVAADATCIPELVRDGVNGQLSPPKDVDSMARQIVDILKDSQKASRFGQAARAEAEGHALAATLDRHEDFYARLLTDRTAAFRFEGHRSVPEGNPLQALAGANDTRYRLFTEVEPFYENLLETIPTAQEQISMMYLTFESGAWGLKLADALRERAASGVQVRLMVDDIGSLIDDPKNGFRNRWLMDYLRESGVQVDIFYPSGWRLNDWNRLHIKICAMDEQAAFVGGSNIGDGYLQMSDHNLRMDGKLGPAFHQVYDYVRHLSFYGKGEPAPDLHLSRLFAGQAQVRLTVPGQRCDIRRTLLDLVLDAEREIYIRKWYFLPDREILDALCSQARNGVAVNILFSHRTPVRPINLANYLHGHELAKSGARVYRYLENPMHAKVAWNDQGKILFGSANMDEKALRSNFECSLVIHDNALSGQLTREFEADTKGCLLQTPSVFQRLPLTTKALSYAFRLATPWL